VDTGAAALTDAARGKAGETIEEAARRLRYGWFRELLASAVVDAVATAHTRDDQAETVVARFLRGAWTEGLGGIHPIVRFPEGPVIRPFLETTRAEVEGYLGSLGQTWREDSSNRHLTITRNRIRHELLPELETWNPRLREHLAQMAELARDEEAWWQAELARLGPTLLAPGRPVRGGGRAGGGGVALEVAQFAGLAPALQRRLLRYAAERLGSEIDFAATEALRNLALMGRAGQKQELSGGLRGERTYRELQLSLAADPTEEPAFAARTVGIPGEIALPELGLRLRIAYKEEAAPGGTKASEVVLRPWKPGDRVRLRHTSAPRKVKEVLERLHVSGSARSAWPVLEIAGRIVWMQGVEIEPEPGINLQVEPLG
jgi:tRNA(Ile)-lysidine synthase